jgi:hypothetical protein
VTSYERVDHALDVMFAADPTLTAFDRNDLATAAGCSPDYASYLLQAHRKAQGRGLTRYVVAARDYARASKWFVLAAPGSPLGTAERRRLTMGHGEHIAVDAARRVLADLRAELDPALVQHPAIQAYLTHAGASMEAQVRLMVNAVHSAVTLVESITGEAADRDHVKAV